MQTPSPSPSASSSPPAKQLGKSWESDDGDDEDEDDGGEADDDNDDSMDSSGSDGFETSHAPMRRGSDSAVVSGGGAGGNGAVKPEPVPLTHLQSMLLVASL